MINQTIFIVRVSDSERLSSSHKILITIKNFDRMKRFIISILIAAVSAIGLFAQDMNAAGDNIIGNYFTDYGGSESRIRITKEKDGSYKAQVFWCSDALDKNGNVQKDVKNPDEKLRNVPVDQIVLIWDLKYNKAKKRWDDGKIYDPTRGIKVNASCVFTGPKSLKIRGTIMGIGETLVWTKEN